jgi:hypothetical protein
MHSLLCAAIKGLGNNSLFLGESPGRDDMIRYLDLVVGDGRPSEGNCDDLARRAG